MAKQSGIHQLRGKVGEHSYYRQTGIKSGLVRSINQGMSSRVKNDEAFLNTRYNNAEFGQAGRLASVLAQYITPKFRPMVLPFSQSKMAKIILEFIKQDTSAPWGQRNITAENSGPMQVSALNSVVKNRFDDYGFTLTIDEETGTLTVAATDLTVSKLSSIGADGFLFNFLATSTEIGKYNLILRRYNFSNPRFNQYRTEMSAPTSGEDFDIKYLVPSSTLAPVTSFAATRTGILIVMPYRMVNQKNFILQEYCTFKAFLISDGAVS